MSLYRTVLYVGPNCWLSGEEREVTEVLRGQERGNSEKLVQSLLPTAVSIPTPASLPSWSSHVCLMREDRFLPSCAREVPGLPALPFSVCAQ